MPRPKRFTKRITIRLSNEQYEQLCRNADAEGMTINMYTRIALNFLARKMKRSLEKINCKMNFTYIE